MQTKMSYSYLQQLSHKHNLKLLPPKRFGSWFCQKGSTSDKPTKKSARQTELQYWSTREIYQRNDTAPERGHKRVYSASFESYERWLSSVDYWYTNKKKFSTWIVCILVLPKVHTSCHTPLETFGATKRTKYWAFSVWNSSILYSLDIAAIQVVNFMTWWLSGRLTFHNIAYLPSERDNKKKSVICYDTRVSVDYITAIGSIGSVCEFLIPEVN